MYILYICHTWITMCDTSRKSPAARLMLHLSEGGSRAQRRVAHELTCVPAMQVGHRWSGSWQMDSRSSRPLTAAAQQGGKVLCREPSAEGWRNMFEEQKMAGDQGGFITRDAGAASSGLGEVSIMNE